MLPYPNISPIALQIGPIAIRWYGVMYLATFVIGYFFIQKFLREKKWNVNKDFVSDLVLAMLAGVILGGRIGYILFYDLAFYIQNPTHIFKVWEGGMSMHGGILGVIIALTIFAKIKKKTLYEVADLVIPIIPIGVGLVRIGGNFINGELYGRITDSKICMKFPTDPENCRYPSQLIQFALEGVIVFIIIYYLRNKIKKPGILSWLFLLLYSIFRFIGEFFREPDAQIGYLLGWMTLGQIFSVLIILIAGIIIGMQYRNKKPLKFMNPST